MGDKGMINKFYKREAWYKAMCEGCGATKGSYLTKCGAIRWLRDDGWVVRKDGTTLCGKCRQKEEK